MLKQRLEEQTQALNKKDKRIDDLYEDLTRKDQIINELQQMNLNLTKMSNSMSVDTELKLSESKTKFDTLHSKFESLTLERQLDIQHKSKIHDEVLKQMV